MKCMKNTNTNEVKRVNDERAAELASKGWAFVPKSDWKTSEGTSWRKNAETSKPMKESKKQLAPEASRDESPESNFFCRVNPRIQRAELI